MSNILTEWSDRIVFEIFIADGGVDDWDTMTEAEIRQIVYRELPNLLAELVTTAALSLQTKP